MMRLDTVVLGAILETLPDPVVVTNARRRIRLANGEALAAFGYGRAELLGRPLEYLLPPAGSGERIVGRRKDGAEFPVEVRVQAAPPRCGSVEIVCIRDTTPWRRSEQAARHAERLATFGILAAEVAHEGKSALGILSSRIELMLVEAEATGLPPLVYDDLAVLRRMTRRLAATFERLLGQAAPAAPAHQPVDLSWAVEETLALLEQSLARRGIRVRAALDPTLPMIGGDAAALQEALVNLILSAREAMPEGGELRVETRLAPDGGGVDLVVADDGLGVSEVVGPGWPPLDARAKRLWHGLASIERTVRAHGAAMDIQSEPARGNTFVVTFPTRPNGDGRRVGGAYA